MKKYTPECMPRFWFVLVLLAVTTCAQEKTTTVFLVRHAEKIEPYASDDPPLAEIGRDRAEALFSQLAVDTLHAFYSTDYIRTQQTLAPTAVSMQADIQLYEAHDYAGLSRRIRRENDGQNVIVAGHSNTILPIIEALGAHPPLDSIGHLDYDYIFKVSLKGNHPESVEFMTFQP
jgi:2,3-bisphosphoglycerate-dependent phosphoglycerate mutase